MPDENRIIEYDGFVAFLLKGPISVDILIELAGRQMNGDGLTANRRLWDFRESKFDLSLDDLKRMAGVLRQADTSPARVALLVTGDLSFGVGRMYEALRASEGTAVMAFKDKTEAVDWLLAEN